MRPEQLQQSWEKAWYEFHRDAEKMPEEATFRISQVFASLSPPEKEIIAQLLARWILSSDEARRFDALALVREHELTSCLPALKDLEKRLAHSSEPGAPYELVKVKGIISVLESCPRE